MGLSPDEGSKEAFEDSNDKPIIKARVFYSNDASDDEHEAKDMGTHFQPLLYFLLFSSYHVFVHSFICFMCYSHHTTP